MTLSPQNPALPPASPQADGAVCGQVEPAAKAPSRLPSGGVAPEGKAGPSLHPRGDGPAPDPSGVARQPAAAPDGTTGREAWRKALSDLHAAQRRGRGRYSRKTAGQRFGPGMARRMPPEQPTDAA